MNFLAQRPIRDITESALTSPGRMFLLRLTVILTVISGVNYIGWRWVYSLNWDAWWIAVPLVAAETYSLIDVMLFGMTMWRARGRAAPPPAAANSTVDVFITTYNEPIELVMATALAAQAIRYPHSTYILDDGDRPEMRAAAGDAGVGYITRSEEWKDRPRHAKAGNLNNALEHSTGEFILILDADQVPLPAILDNTLGYFHDDLVALVQTPQVFSNVSTGDPLGSQAPLFYGPIQQGKDGWNAAFFCGSNAVLRREALMQLGIVGYLRDLDRSTVKALRTAARAVAKAQSHPAAARPEVRAALNDVEAAIEEARIEIAEGAPIASITYKLHRRADAASYSLVAADVVGIESDLAEIRAMARSQNVGRPPVEAIIDIEHIVSTLSDRELSPLNALESVQAVIQRIAIDRPGEAQPIMPLATISVTEDMATCMRLHGLGLKSVYHHELLAIGLAPEDAGTMLTQRLRWAQGTMQVFLRENPLLQKNLSVPQRLMYFATMWSYISGFAATVYFAAPIIFLILGILPVSSNALDFFIRFIPFIIVNQILFVVSSKGAPTWRGQQYSLALFPVWIEACVSALNNVVLRIPLGFAVTPKTRQVRIGTPWRLIRVQLIVMMFLGLAIGVGLIHLLFNEAQFIGTTVNIAWAVFDLVILSVLLKAVSFRGFEPTTWAGESTALQEDSVTNHR